MKNRFVIFVVVIILGLVITLLACGGGGGSDGLGLDAGSVSATATAISAPAAEGAQGAINEVINALGSGDLSKVQTNFDTESWNNVYSSVILSSDFDRTALAQYLYNAELVFQMDNYALYRVTKVISGTESTCDIHMIKINGLWKIHLL